MKVTICTSFEALSQFNDELEELGNESSEPNVFYHKYMLLPALRHLAVSSPIVILIWSDQAQAKLAAAIPLERRTHFHHVPLFHLCLWEYKHCFLSTPLIRRGEEESCFEELCNWAYRGKPSPLFLNLTQCAGSESVAKALSSFAAKTSCPLSLGPTTERALIDFSGTWEEYFERYPKKMRGNFERRRRHLEEKGELRYTLLEREEHLSSWLSEFLVMEASGWKGTAGSALALKQGDILFLKETLEEAFKGRILEFSKLALNGRTLSMRICFVQQGVRFLFKIAYDENMKQYSPGVLLEIEEMKRLLNGKERVYVDSCADPSNEFMNSLFLERLKIQTFRLGLPSAQSKAAICLVSAAERVRNNMRRYSKVSSLFSQNRGTPKTIALGTQ